jgi:hypothetical protein
MSASGHRIQLSDNSLTLVRICYFGMVLLLLNGQKKLKLDLNKYQATNARTLLVTYC